MKLRLAMAVLMLTVVSMTLKSQQIVVQPDSTYTPSAQQIDSLSQHHPVVFSNKGCGRCTLAKNFLSEHHIPFFVIDIGLPANRGTMYTIAHEAAGSNFKGIHYPVIVYKELTQYGQDEINIFLDKLLEIINHEDKPTEE